MTATTRQLRELVASHPDSLVEVDVLALASDGADAEIERAATEAGDRLERGRLAVVATPRERPEPTRTLEAGQRIAANLARVAGSVEPHPDVVLAKGGITAAVTARVGLAARRALVLGPLVDGVAVWRVDGGGGEISYVVFPGNVGDDGTLRDVVDSILEA